MEAIIRDHSVVGVREHALSTRLQMEADLTLEKPKKMVCRREAIHKHQEIDNSSPSSQTLPKSVDTVRQKDHRKSS